MYAGKCLVCMRMRALCTGVFLRKKMRIWCNFFSLFLTSFCLAAKLYLAKSRKRQGTTTMTINCGWLYQNRQIQRLCMLYMCTIYLCVRVCEILKKSGKVCTVRLAHKIHRYVTKFPTHTVFNNSDIEFMIFSSC